MKLRVPKGVNYKSAFFWGVILWIWQFSGKGPAFAFGTVKFLFLLLVRNIFTGCSYPHIWSKRPKNFHIKFRSLILLVWSLLKHFLLHIPCVFLKLIYLPTYALNKTHFMTFIKLHHVSAPGRHPREVFL